MRRATIVLNGASPGRRLLHDLAGQCDLLVAADGGAQSLSDVGLVPVAVVGDLDSFQPDMLLEPSRTQVVRVLDQDSTDAEKALRWVLDEGAQDIVLAGTHSLVLDHVLGTLSIAARFAHQCRLRLVETDVIAWFVTGTWEREIEPGTTVSLVGLGEAQGIHTVGLRWPLLDETLRFGEREGVRNEAVTSPVRVSLSGGCLAVILARSPDEEFLW